MDRKTLSYRINTLKSTIKANWNHPKEGESLSLKEFFSFCLGAMGINGYTFINNLVNFSAACYLIGAIMGITFKEIYYVNLISAVIGYIFIFMSPINMLIVDNHGKLAPKVMKFGATVSLLQIIVGISLYFVPSQSFEWIIKGFPQIVANLLVCSGIAWFFGLYIRRKYCAKYGRYKPWMIICGIPTAILISSIAYLPYETMNHTQILISVHLMFTLLAIFYGPYVHNVYNMGTLMSSNPQERQRIWSFGPIATGLWRSILAIIFPLMAILTGGYLSITTYRVFVPILALVSVTISFNVIRCHERIIEPKVKKKDVNFKKGAKNVFKNKYMWMTYTSDIFAFLVFVADNVMNWYFIYSLRLQWVMGIAGGMVAISSVGGNLLTPKLTKKYEKRNVYVVSRLIWAGLICSLLIAVRLENIFLFMAIAFIRNFISTISQGVGNTFKSDILEQHQWKTGDRADGLVGVFGWIVGPIGLALGFLIPFILQTLGLTSDWDVMFDNNIADRIYSAHIILAVSGLVLTTLPYLFYDLTRDKMKVIIQELRDRAQQADEQALMELESIEGGE